MVVVGVKLDNAERDHNDNGKEIPFRRFCWCVFGFIEGDRRTAEISDIGIGRWLL
jgi:hypothetical protein